MRLIVTGATGFVGKNLLKHFDDYPDTEIIPLSLRVELPRKLEGDAVIHLAGKAHDLKKSVDPQEYFRVNYEKTKALFELFLISDIKDFIYFSSVKAVADSVDNVLLEDVTPDPQTFYGKSKLKAEQYLLLRPLPKGKRLFIFRPCMIHGPENKGNLNLLYKIIKKGIPYPLGTFENERSFLSIDNLLFVLEQVLNDQQIKGGVYNVSDDSPLSTTDLIKLLAKASNSRGVIWNVPRGIIKFIANVGDILNLPLNSERLQKLTENYVVSNAKIKEALQIRKMPKSVKEGLIKTVKNF